MRDLSELPDGWRIVRLKDVCDLILDGDWIESKDQGGSDYRLIQLSNIGVGSFIETGKFRWITQETFEDLNCTEVYVGDVLIARMPDPVGRAIYVSELLSKAVVAVDIAIVRTRQGALDSKYLSYWLNSAECLRKMSGFATGTTRKRIRRSDIEMLRFALPPLPEQRAIAAVLDAVDEAIEHTEAVIYATECLRDALLHELLTRGVPGWHSEWRTVPGLGTVPADWQVVRLKELLVLDQPGAWGGDPTSTDPGVRVLRAADLTRDGRVVPDRAAWRRLPKRDLERRQMRDGDIILERSGGGPGTPVGRVALIDGIGPIYCNNFCQHLRVDASRCSPHYAVRALWHRYLRGVTARLEHQTTGIRNLDYPGYLAFPLPLPSLAEQHAITGIVGRVDSSIERTVSNLERLKSLKASAADALLTGRVRALIPMEAMLG